MPSSSTPPFALSDPPQVSVVTLEVLAPNPHGFLRIDRRRCSVRGPDGTQTDPFTYDAVVRQHADAVVIVAHFDREGECCVYLRSCIRPPLSFRERQAEGSDEPGQSVLWELPAGLIEEEGDPEHAAKLCAAREAREEIGIDVDPESFRALGSYVLPSAGVLAERQYFVHCEVDPRRRSPPTEDGSPLERFGEVLEVPLREALRACARGLIPDAKTELGLRRLSDLLRASDR